MVITSVIVTYNRQECLKKLLDSYEHFSKKPNNIIVVNNNSIDCTYNLLQDWVSKKSKYSKYVIHLEKNIGGSGGFYEGLKKALDIKSDWIYLSDDDAFPNKNLFEVFRNFILENYEYKDDIAAICGKVINYDFIDVEHRRRIIKNKLFVKEYSIKENEYNSNFELDLFSYVGTMINSKHLKDCGLTERDYFIYYDDTEHSLRLRKSGRIICIPNAEIIHNTKQNSNEHMSWKNFYGYRNRLLMIKKHYSKRYFIIQCGVDRLRMLKRVLKFKFNEAKLIDDAIKDAKKDIKGINIIYKPGHKIN